MNPRNPNAQKRINTFLNTQNSQKPDNQEYFVSLRKKKRSEMIEKMREDKKRFERKNRFLISQVPLIPEGLDYVVRETVFNCFEYATDLNEKILDMLIRSIITISKIPTIYKLITARYESMQYIGLVALGKLIHSLKEEEYEEFKGYKIEEAMITLSSNSQSPYVLSKI